MDFHRALLDESLIEQTDGRPTAVNVVQRHVTPQMREELRAWLEEQFAISSRVVIKDPRTAWAPSLWQDTARSLQIPLSYVTILRSPAEVLASRATYYGEHRGAMKHWNFNVKNLCGWVSMNLIAERHTRKTPRVWMNYADLLRDSRGPLRRVRDELGVSFDLDLDDPSPNAVDEFIDPTLRRHELSLTELDMPGGLASIAEDLWNAAQGLTHGDPAGVGPTMDAIYRRYQLLLKESMAISHHSRLNELRAERLVVAGQVREEALRAAKAAAAEAAAAEAAAAKAAAARAVPPTPPPAAPRRPVPRAVHQTLQRIPRRTRRRLRGLLED